MEGKDRVEGKVEQLDTDSFHEVARVSSFVS